MERRHTLKGFQYVRKALIIQVIRRCFFRDYPDCQKVDAEFLNRLHSIVPHHPQQQQQPAESVVPQRQQQERPMLTPPAADPFRHPSRYELAERRANGGAYHSAHGSSSSGEPPLRPTPAHNLVPVVAAAAAPVAAANIYDPSNANATNAARSVANRNIAFTMDRARVAQAPPHRVDFTIAPPPDAAGRSPSPTHGNNSTARRREDFHLQQVRQQQQQHHHQQALQQQARQQHRQLTQMASGQHTEPIVAARSTPNVRKRTYVKTEGTAGDPDRTPQTGEERNIMGQLQQMSFTDPSEMLASIRRMVQRLRRPPTADEAMLDIITQREESAEAVKMDEARLLSEQTRKTDAANRRAQIQRELQGRMETCSVMEWLQAEKMFPKSWLLRHGATLDTVKRRIGPSRTALKCKFLDLLKLERDSLKWYREMPQSYFRHVVAHRLIGAPSSSMLRQVEHEIETLNRVMYIMSEQVGGVPKVFRDAHDAAVELNVNRQGDNDDDDVEVIIALSPKCVNTPISSSSQTLYIPKSTCKNAMDIIDLT